MTKPHESNGGRAMLIKIKSRHDVLTSKITAPEVYADRRRFLRLGAGSLLTAAALSSGLLSRPAQAGAKQPNVSKGPYNAQDELTPLESITRYNNKNKNNTNKKDPARLAGSLKTRPWT